MFNSSIFLEKTTEASKRIIHVAYKNFVENRRCLFHDLSKIKPNLRQAKSPVIQFYSSANNIGNYLPVLGIGKMLSQTPDTWCIHDKEIDFEFINANYKCAIIGGAGLLVVAGGRFEKFWKKFLDECKIPAIIWGVGGDAFDTISDSYRKTVASVSKRCDLVNVRDRLTAETFGLTHYHISACPTIVYLQSFSQRSEISGIQHDPHITLVCYPHLLYGDADLIRMKKMIKKVDRKSILTTNYQYSFKGLNDLIQIDYNQSNLIVTTNLHGAIIAYGLKIPYIAILKTDKIRAFCQTFQNGLGIEYADDLEALLNSQEAFNIPLRSPEIEPVYEFGFQALAWVKEVCSPRPHL
jgi:Polysaccharide pyruvyl transferase